MQNLVVLISGRGSNMEAVAQACHTQRWPARIGAVLADRPEAAGLARARALGLHAEVLAWRDHPSREAYDAALADRVAPTAL